MHAVSLAQQQLGQLTAILTGDAGNKSGALCHGEFLSNEAIRRVGRCLQNPATKLSYFVKTKRQIHKSRP
ncbi:hypothetical protein NBRC116588_07930 [Pyruvatibacter sp. HU-CL02332]